MVPLTIVSLTIQLNISHLFTQLNNQTSVSSDSVCLHSVQKKVLFDPGATKMGKSESGSNGNEGIHCIPLSSSITVDSLSDSLKS